MAKAKTSKKKDQAAEPASPARRGGRTPGRRGLGLSTDTRRGIWSVVLFALALLTLLSLFSFAGLVGEYWRKFLGFFVGLGTLIMPVVLAGAGLLIMRGQKIEHIRARTAGFITTVVALLALFHVWTNTGEMVEAANAGQGGGWIGTLLALPLRGGLGLWGAVIVLIAVMLIGILLLFDVGVSALWAKLRRNRPAKEDIQVRGIEETPEEPAIKTEKKTLLGSLFSRKKVQPATDQTQAGTEGNANAEATDLAQQTPAKPERAKADPEIQIRNVPDSVVPKGPALQVKDMQYELPSLDLLDSKMGRPTAGDIKANVRKIRRTLENFGIPVEMGDVSIGPTVTQYTFKPAEGVKLSAITALQNDLALALAAHPVRIEAPIPGKSLVGLEVPNVGVALVRLREILASQPYQSAKDPLTIGLGRDVAGNPVVANLAKMPHLLIAGATGSGKSVTINSLLMSLLFRNSPQTLKLILVDPKRVELTAYNNIPHLVTPVITETKKTVHALRWCVAEMDKRYELLNASGKRNILSYNSSAHGQKLPYITVVIDELADLMAVAANDVESAIVRLAQMARAVGIHLVVATQRPSVDVITGLIKANITSRMAFNVASSIDSRTILDHAGAEKLLGNGDMLYITASLSKPKRIQSAFVSESEVEKVTDFIRSKNGAPEYVEAIATGQVGGGSAASAAAMGAGEESDPMLEDAKKVIIENQKASASLLQRRLSVGYARAARLLDLMEEKGWIGPGQGAKPREIFIGRDNGTLERADDASLDEIPTPDEVPPPPEDPDMPPPTEDYRG
ncbi:MAG: DNA translocase FtsK 4TM domain-containing protein [Candidatus Andersenbacteria bacterium]